MVKARISIWAALTVDGSWVLTNPRGQVVCCWEVWWRPAGARAYQQHPARQHWWWIWGRSCRGGRWSKPTRRVRSPSRSLMIQWLRTWHPSRCLHRAHWPRGPCKKIGQCTTNLAFYKSMNSIIWKFFNQRYSIWILFFKKKLIQSAGSLGTKFIMGRLGKVVCVRGSVLAIRNTRYPRKMPVESSSPIH